MAVPWSPRLVGLKIGDCLRCFDKFGRKSDLSGQGWQCPGLLGFSVT